MLFEKSGFFFARPRWSFEGKLGDGKHCKISPYLTQNNS